MPNPVVETGSRVKYEDDSGLRVVGTILEFRETEIAVADERDGFEWRFEPRDLWNGKITIYVDGEWKALQR